MWISRKELEKLKQRVETLRGAISSLLVEHNKEFHSDVTLYCETCGCIVQTQMAVAGEPIIREYTRRYGPPPRYIHYPYYCRTHAPHEEIREVRI